MCREVDNLIEAITRLKLTVGCKTAKLTVSYKKAKLTTTVKWKQFIKLKSNLISSDFPLPLLCRKVVRRSS